VRYIGLVVLIVSGACKVIDWPSEPSMPPAGHVDLRAARVSPTELNAGDPFTAYESATFTDCGPLYGLQIEYAGNAIGGGNADSPMLTVSLTAVVGDTDVVFEGECNGVFTPLKKVTIQVIPPT
jgi:hypothetical protein